MSLESRMQRMIEERSTSGHQTLWVILRRIKTGYDLVTKSLAYGALLLGGLCTLSMMVIITVNVTLRTFFDGHIPGTITFVQIAMIPIIFLPLAWAALTNEGHIRVTMLVSRLKSANVRHKFSLLANLITAAFSALVAVAATDKAIKSWSLDEAIRSEITIPVWPARFLILIGSLLLTLSVLAITVRFHHDTKSP